MESERLAPRHRSAIANPEWDLQTGLPNDPGLEGEFSWEGSLSGYVPQKVRQRGVPGGGGCLNDSGEPASR
jgi:hypothetical protein